MQLSHLLISRGISTPNVKFTLHNKKLIKKYQLYKKISLFFSFVKQFQYFFACWIDLSTFLI